jgi:RNA polymerase sigma factor (sigma-70 family)
MEAAALTGALSRGLPATGQARLLRLAGDDRLVGAVRAGSDAAFEVLYERHHRSLLAFCRHMLGSREEAEDAAQSTFLVAYHELRTDDDRPIQLRPWLYTIARHRCLRILRARKPQAEADLEDHPVATDGLGEQVQRRDDLRELLGDLGRLPEDQRAALLLAELHAMSHREIAAVLDVPTQKVKALVFQARSSLIASRKARDVPCSEVRTQLAELSGGSLRRRELQRHLRSCPGCREFRSQLRRQKAMLAATLPVVPSAGLRAAVLGATTGGAGGAGTGGLLATAAALKGVAAKLAIGAGATAALAGGVIATADLSGLHVGRHGRTVMAAPARPAPGPPGPATAPVVGASASQARALGAAAPTAASRRHGRVSSAPAADGHRHGARRHRRTHTSSAPAAATTTDAASEGPARGQGRARGRGGSNANANSQARQGPKAPHGVPKAQKPRSSPAHGNGRANGVGRAATPSHPAHSSTPSRSAAPASEAPAHSSAAHAAAPAQERSSPPGQAKKALRTSEGSSSSAG